IDELKAFLHDKVPEDSMFANIKPTPLPDIPAELWLLGTSERSALLAADKGMAYAFGHFMSDFSGPDLVQTYREQFTEKDGQKPSVIIAVHVICAPTTEEAYQIAKSTRAWGLLQAKQHEDLRIPSLEEVDAYAWTAEERRKLESEDRRLVIGNPEEVARELNELANLYEADELMLVTITHDPEAKFTSYKLVAEAMAESK
ncbi:MAG TPA: LLM class flavin-dependent oxidoreductase, partial [Pseudogracilibacillus sp.]|nr:LLM class flavin-dependent oxidoreductase [Pseudogracilibacillus sp.]